MCLCINVYLFFSDNLFWTAHESIDMRTLIFENSYTVKLLVYLTFNNMNLYKKKFEDTKGVIRSLKSKKDKQYNRE